MANDTVAVEFASHDNTFPTMLAFGTAGFASMIGLIYVIGVRLQWRLDRAICYLVQSSYIAKRHIAVLAIGSILPYVLCAWSYSVFVFWGYRMASNGLHLPGLTAATVGPGTLILLFGIANWRSKGWRVVAPRTSRISTPLVCLFVFLASFYIFAFASVFTRSTLSYIGLSWLFFSFNMIPMIAIAYLNAPGGSGNAAEWISGTTHSGADITDSVQEKEANETVNALIYTVLSSRSEPDGLRYRDVALYLTAVAILVVYATLNFVFASNAVDSGKQLGFVTATSVLVLDLVSYLSFQGGLITSPGPLCMLILASRAALVSFGATYWFLGHTTVYLVYGCTLAYLTAVRLVPADNPAELAATPASPAQPRQLSLSMFCSCQRSHIAHPLLILLLLTAAFGSLLLYSRSHPLGLPDSPVFGLDTPHAQWEFGVASLCTVLVVLLLCCTLRSGADSRRKRAFRLGTTGRVLACVTECALLGSGLLLFTIMRSVSLLAAFLLLPPAVVAAKFAYGRWREADFNILGPKTLRKNSLQSSTQQLDSVPGRFSSGILLCPPGRTCETSCIRAWSTGDFRDMNSCLAFIRCGLSRDDSAMILALLSCVSLVLTLSMIAHLSTAPGARFVIWIVTGASLELLITSLAAIQWFNTLEASSSFLTMLGAAVVLHGLLHGFLYLYSFPGLKADKRKIVALFSVVVYPTIVLLSCAWYKWWDDKWVTSRFVKLCFLGATLILLAASAIVTVFFQQSVGIACAVLTLLGMYFSITIGVWAQNGFFLPQRWSILTCCVTIVIAMLAIAAGWFVQSLTSFWAGSVSWGCLTALLVCFAVSRLQGARVLLIRSFSLFPIYALDGSSLLPSNLGTAAVYSSLLMSFLWGVCATAVLPVIYIGLAVSSLTIVLALIYTAHMMRYPRVQFANACRLLQSAEDPALLRDTLVEAFHDAAATHLSNQLQDGKFVVSPAGPSSLSSSPLTGMFRSTVQLLEQVSSIDNAVSTMLWSHCSFVGERRVAPAQLGSSSDLETGAAPNLEDDCRRLLELDNLVNLTQRAEMAFSAHLRSLVIIRSRQLLVDIEAEFRGLLAWCRLPQNRELVLQLHLLQPLGIDAPRCIDSISLSDVYDWCHQNPPQFQSFCSLRNEFRRFRANEAAERSRRERVDAEAAARRAAAESQAELRKWQQQHEEETRIIQSQINAAAAAEIERLREVAAEAVQQIVPTLAPVALAEENTSVVDEPSAPGDDLSSLSRAEQQAALWQLENTKEEEELGRREQQAVELVHHRDKIQAELERAEAKVSAEAEAEAQSLMMRLMRRERTKAGTDAVGEHKLTLEQGTVQADQSSAAHQLHQLQEHCEQNGVVFQDASFYGTNALCINETPAENDTLGAITEWLRPRQFYEDCPLDVLPSQACGAEDISQGQLGDCWLLSAMSVLARRPTLLAKVLAVKSYNEAGVYAVNLFKNGRWEQVIVDDRFPCIAHGDQTSLAFVSSKAHSHLWMSIIEKAYAKQCGSYEAIEGGFVHLGLVDLTGGAGEEIKLADPATRRQIGSGALWERLVRYSEAGHLLGAGSPAGSDTDVSAMGIVQGHAYAVLRVAQEHDSNGTHRLLQLHNPWGQTEWTGDWSDSDEVHWTRRIRKRLDYDPQSTSEDDDGIFWMSFADFTQHFSSIYVCRLFSEVQDGGSWYRYSATDRWEGTTAGGSPTRDHPNAVHNPQFYLQVSQPTAVFITLTQENVVGDADEHYICLQVLNKQGNRAAVVYEGESVADSGNYTNVRQVSAEFSLKPCPGGPYTIFCSTYDAACVADMRIQVYSDFPLHPCCVSEDGVTLQPLPPSHA